MDEIVLGGDVGVLGCLRKLIRWVLLEWEMGWRKLWRVYFIVGLLWVILWRNYIGFN